MQTIQSFFKKLWATPFVHGLAMAIIGAVTGLVIPFIQAWTESQPTPTFHTIWTTAFKVAVAAVVTYLIKNGMIGSSNSITPSGK